jgi:lipopolysaccharide transport system permease protein
VADAKIEQVADAWAACPPIHLSNSIESALSTASKSSVVITAIKNIIEYRELIAVLAWKNITVRYKQAYLGIGWAVLKPLALMLVFTLIRSIVGIPSGNVPYPILAFAALMPWIFFQESASEGVQSVVGNAALIRKIYFPREVFPITGIITKLVELGINAIILVALMLWFRVVPSVYVVWAPIIIIYTMLASLAIALAGAAMNVYYRDVGAAMPVLLSLLMYASPVIYPLELVKNKLLVQRVAGEWSDVLYTLYTLNPLAGIIDSFQNVVLRGAPPDFGAILPGAILVAFALPISYLIFKRAESYFADVI